jgi:threonine dehydrogenase-like Zn-dependent dehydrogenase
MPTRQRYAHAPADLDACPEHCYAALGAKVIAAAGSASKLEVSKTHGGADHAVDYTQPGWQKQVLQLTGGRGVDVIYDPVGMIKGPPAAFGVRGG